LLNAQWLYFVIGRYVRAVGEPMKNLSTITINELFTGWWTERWVRGLVLMLIPIGIIDSVYTVAMTSIYGFEIEFNPITRELLAAGLWFPWAITNVLGFTFFCMMAGSYYLHTRSRPEGPDTFALSFVIALRVAMVGYNVTFYYIPWAGGMVYPPFWSAGISFVVTLYWMNKLLNRVYDISWAQTKHILRSRYDNYRDAKLITSTGIRKRVTTSSRNWNRESKIDIKNEIPKTKRVWWKGTWLKRVVYISGAFVSILMIGLSIQVINEITGLSSYSEGVNYFVLNEVTGPPFMASFLAIIFFMGISLGLIFKAFSESEDADI